MWPSGRESLGFRLSRGAMNGRPTASPRQDATSAGTTSQTVNRLGSRTIRIHPARDLIDPAGRDRASGGSRGIDSSVDFIDTTDYLPAEAGGA